MNIKLELLSKKIAEMMIGELKIIEADVNKIADKEATNALSEIQKVIINEDLSDFNVI